MRAVVELGGAELEAKEEKTAAGEKEIEYYKRKVEKTEKYEEMATKMAQGGQTADEINKTLTVLAGSVLHAYPLFRRVLKDRPRVVRVEERAASGVHAGGAHAERERRALERWS